MTVIDIRDVKFYVCEEGPAAIGRDMPPLDFDAAFSQARALADSGRPVHVMYTDGASQSQLTELARRGIPASLAPQG